MNWQWLAADAIVCACAVYAGWVLMPAAARRACARRLRALPLPARGAAAIEAATRAGGCGCDGCPSNEAGRITPVRVVRRR